VRASVRRALKLFLFLLGAFVLTDMVYPMVWLLAPLEGTVVDRVTRKPVPHAVVAASWEIRWLAHAGQLDVAEGETDQGGRFRVSRWRLRWWPLPGYLVDDAPVVWTIRDGYMPDLTRPSRGPQRFVSHIPELRVELEPASPPTLAYGQAMQELALQMSAEFVTTPCNWLRIPNFAQQVERAQRLLVAKDIAAGAAVTTQVRDCRKRR
jgi:hypothetical protein